MFMKCYSRQIRWNDRKQQLNCSTINKKPALYVHIGQINKEIQASYQEK